MSALPWTSGIRPLRVRALRNVGSSSLDPAVQAAHDAARALLSAGDIHGALATYRAEWDRLLAASDHFHASVIAHQAGAIEPDTARKHEWNTAALAEADAVRDLMVSKGMYASLYNNLGLSHWLLGEAGEARRCYELAMAHLSDITPGPYADQCRGGIERNIARLG